MLTGVLLHEIKPAVPVHMTGDPGADGKLTGHFMIPLFLVGNTFHHHSGKIRLVHIFIIEFAGSLGVHLSIFDTIHRCLSNLLYENNVL